MKEPREKNARIPPGSACSAVPGLSVEPPPLGADSGFTAFHTAPVAFGGVPGCLDPDCAANGCYLVRSDDVGPGICDNGCRVVSQYFTTRSVLRNSCAPELSPPLFGDVSGDPATRPWCDLKAAPVECDCPRCGKLHEDGRPCDRCVSHFGPHSWAFGSAP